MPESPLPSPAPNPLQAQADPLLSSRVDPDPEQSGVLVALGTAAPDVDPDMELLDAWKAGSKKALDVLFKRYERRIFAICLRMLGNPEVAADVAQDAFLRIYEGLRKFDGRARFSTWSVRVTLNCVYSFLRRERLRRHAPLPEPGEGRDPRSAEPAPHQRVEQVNLRRDVVTALGGIDLEARAILVLRDLQGLDYADIAEVIGTPIGTVKSRLFRARAALRESLEQRGHQGRVPRT
ncbi:MAG: RNA polymerase sigma factor [Phycisphaerales bacterium]|nr:RNA polymerase sigma factor [Phycisphaerales bacterium]